MYELNLQYFLIRGDFVFQLQFIVCFDDSRKVWFIANLLFMYLLAVLVQLFQSFLELF